MSWLISQALMKDYENLRCLQEQAAEYSAATSSGGEQSVPLSGNPTQLAFLPSDRMTDFSRLSRFGMTFKPLTEDLGTAVLMWFQEDSRARTSALQARAQESTESDQACGPTWRGSLARFDPATSSWRTAQHSLLEDLGESSVIWPRSGMTAGGQCWELPTLGRRISGTGSGLSESWPTPRCHMTRPVRVRMDVEKGHKSNLEEVVAVRATWPTPTVCGNYNRKGASATSGDGLATAVLKFQTPVARMHKDNGRNPSELDRNSPTLAMQAGGSLNPTWVEWLMGWPLGWTDLRPLATDKFHFAPQQPGDC